MTSRRIGFVAGGLLAGAVLMGTAGFVAAEDPTATKPSGSAGMMAGQMGGMMGGQKGAGMMGGQMGTGMMGGQMGTLTADQFKQMDELHDQMLASGVCDPAQMQAFHAQLNANR